VTVPLHLLPPTALEKNTDWWLVALRGSWSSMLDDDLPCDVVVAWTHTVKCFAAARLHRPAEMKTALEAALWDGVPASWLVEHAQALPRLADFLAHRFGPACVHWERTLPPVSVEKDLNARLDHAEASDAPSSVLERREADVALFANAARSAHRAHALTLGTWALTEGASALLDAWLAHGWNPVLPLLGRLTEAPAPAPERAAWTPLAWAAWGHSPQAWDRLWAEPRVKADSASRDEAAFVLAYRMSMGHVRPESRTREMVSRLPLLLEAGASLAVPFPAPCVSLSSTKVAPQSQTWTAGERVFMALTPPFGWSEHGRLWPRLQAFVESFAAAPSPGNWRFHPDLALPESGDEALRSDVLDVAQRFRPASLELLAQAAWKATQEGAGGWPLAWARRHGVAWTLSEVVERALRTLDMGCPAPAALPDRHWSSALSREDVPAWEETCTVIQGLAPGKSVPEVCASPLHKEAVRLALDGTRLLLPRARHRL